MSDYAKRTVAELQEILKSRGLPSSGKKAELVARLNENDKEASVPEEAPTASEPEPAVAAQPAQPATTTVTDTTSAPSTSAAEQPIEPTSTDAAEHPSPDTALASQTNYSLNLPTSTLDDELAKRKARAERFGTGAPKPGADELTAATTAETTAEDAEALKNLERAKRFGTGQTAIGKLDEALSSELGRGSRKRTYGAVAEGTELDDPGLKRSFANRGRGRGGRFGGRSRGGKSPSGAKPSGVSKPAPAYTTEKDKLAAEARKKKFATA